MLRYLYQRDYEVDSKLPLLHVSNELPLRFALDHSAQDASLTHAMEEASLASGGEHGLTSAQQQTRVSKHEPSDYDCLSMHMCVHGIGAYYSIPTL